MSSLNKKNQPKITVNRKPFHNNEIRKSLSKKYNSHSKKELEDNIKNQISEEIKLIRAQSQKISQIKYEYLKLSTKIKEELEQFNLQKEKELQQIQKWKKEQVKLLNINSPKKHEGHVRNNSSFSLNPNYQTSSYSTFPTQTNSNNVNCISISSNSSHKTLSKDKNSKSKMIINTLKKKIKDVENEHEKKDLNDKLMINKLKHQLEEVRIKLQKIKKDIQNSSNINNIKINRGRMKSQNSVNDMNIPAKYNIKKEIIISKIVDNHGDISIKYTNNINEYIYHSGIKKIIFPDGFQIFYFPNGDIKQIYPNNYKTIYYYSKDQVYMMFYGNNELEKIYKYQDGTTVKEYENGKKEYLKENKSHSNIKIVDKNNRCGRTLTEVL